MRSGRLARGALVALAVVGLVATAVWSGTRRDRTSAVTRDGLQELATALAREPARLFDGRLSGGLPHVPTRARSRGDDGEASPEVRIAVARIEVAERGRDTPDAAAALGAAYVVVADWDRAIASLTDAVEQNATDSAFQNDLSVAYAGRATARARSDDWVRALAAADRAIALDPQRAEAYFNRALAFNGLHLAADEAEAWQQFQRLETSGPWHNESKARAEALRARRDAPRPPPETDHQAVREQIEDRFLSDWGRAYEEQRADAATAALEQAADRADRLAAAAGDVMARDAVALIRRAQQSGDDRLVRELAKGHRLYGDARRLYLADNQMAASQLMDEAAEHFTRAGSPYAQWAPVYRALYLRSNGQSLRGLEELAGADVSGLPAEYYHLRGRLAWTEALLRDAIARFDLARGQLETAVAAYRSAGEAENLIATETNLAEANWYLGDYPNAWSHLVAALARIDSRSATRRTAHFDLAAVMAQGAGLTYAALDFQNAFVRVVTTPRARAEALLRRARTLLLVDRDADAERDLEQASLAVTAIGDPGIRDRITADIEIVRVELLGRADCTRSIERGEATRAFLAKTGASIRMGTLLTVMARCRRMTGDTTGAVADLQQAVGLLESRRRAIASAFDRIQAFEAERAVFTELLTLESIARNDQNAALAVAERSRDGVLAEVWSNRVADWRSRMLPPGVVVIYYQSLPDRVLVWVLTRDETTTFSAGITDVQLRRHVDRVRRAIENGADLARLRPIAAPLFDVLIAPALAQPAVAAAPTVVFIPDAALFGLPFGALPDAENRPLIETRTVAIAPSLRTFFAASDRLSSFAPRSVLAVGDGHDVKASGLPRLPRANDEAADVGRIYRRSAVLLGGDATRTNFLRERADVVHFAGHSVLNERYPMFSRMLLAPYPANGDPGWLQASEITSDQFARTGVVFLASCDGAAGEAVQGEGAISLARAFFAAGVPAVVASLWPVDDDLQTIVHTFHETLIARRDPARALRDGQLAILRERGPHTPVREWGGFIMLGGSIPVRPEEQKRG